MIAISAYEKKTFFTTSTFLDELDFAGLQKMSLADFIIIQIQIQILAAKNKSLLEKIYEKWKIF